MKLSGKLLACVVTLAVAGALCVPAVAFAGTTATLKAGKTTKVTLYAPSKTKGAVTLKVKGQKASSGVWKSSKEKVATVKAGKVVAKKAGKTTITVKYGKKTYKAKITVKKTAINKKSASLEVGKRVTLKLVGDKIKKVETSSAAVAVKLASNKQKVTVTAKAAGSAKVKLTSKKGKAYTCKVTVTSPVVAVTSVSFAKTTIALKKGDAAVANPATVKPSNATDKRVVYSSSNESVATVDGKGNITAHEYGVATVVAAAYSGGKTSTCTVFVTDLDPDQLKPVAENVDASKLKEALDGKDINAIVQQLTQALEGAGIDTSAIEKAGSTGDMALLTAYIGSITSKMSPELQSMMPSPFSLNPPEISADDIQQALDALTSAFSK